MAFACGGKPSFRRKYPQFPQCKRPDRAETLGRSVVLNWGRGYKELIQLLLVTDISRSLRIATRHRPTCRGVVAVQSKHAPVKLVGACYGHLSVTARDPGTEPAPSARLPQEWSPLPGGVYISVHGNDEQSWDVQEHRYIYPVGRPLE